MYPEVKFSFKDCYNMNWPMQETKHNVRDKLCLKIQAREAETDYFLTVFERKSFGNEKVYEKRLNLKRRQMKDAKLEFHPKGTFLLVTFDLYKYEIIEQKEEEHKEGEIVGE